MLHVTAGCCAGMIASSATFPADVVMRSMQVGTGQYRGVLDCFKKMLAEHGWRCTQRIILLVFVLDASLLHSYLQGFLQRTDSGAHEERPCANHCVGC